jgi:tRNA(Ile)-lysidine synthase
MSSASLSLENRVLRYIHQEALFGSREGVLVACSGGPDSLTLLSILYHWREKLGHKLAIAWFNHGLRPGQMVFEQTRVKDYAHQFGIDFYVGMGNTRAYASEHGQSIEEAARELRYRFLGETCLKLGFKYIATGHTASDNAETVLIHILRGCGIEGLVGLRSVSGLPIDNIKYRSLKLVRPLLSLGRSDTEAYCLMSGLKYITDPSNRSPRFLRNRVRHELLPLLEELNPSIRHSILRLSRAAADASDVLDQQVLSARLPNYMADGSLELSRKQMAAMLPAVLVTYLRTALRRVLPGLTDINFYQLCMLSALAAGPPGRSLHLPGGNLAICEDEILRIRTPSSNQINGHTELPITPLEIPCRIRWGQWVITSCMVASPKEKSMPDGAYFDAQEAGSRLSIGPWCPGDRIQPLGMAGEKKLQDIFTDMKVTREQRKQWPVVRSGKCVLWVPGLRQAEWARVKLETRRVLKLTCRRIT